VNITFDHVSLRVTDLDRSVAFYRDEFGLELVSRRDNGSQAVFRIGESLLVLFCSSEYEAVSDDARSGADHVAFCLDPQSYDALFQRLKQNGRITREPTRNSGAHGQGLAIYFADPDGNPLEIKKYEG